MSQSKLKPASTLHTVSIMARVDSLESQRAAKNAKTTIVGTKILRFVPSGAQYSCVKSSEIKVSLIKENFHSCGLTHLILM